MSIPSKNPLELQNELQKSLKNSSVTEGRPVLNSIEHPAVESPMKTVQNKDGHFDIVDASGNVVGKITGAIFGLAKGALNSVKKVGSVAVEAVTDVVDIGIGAIGTIGRLATGTVKNISEPVVDGVASGIHTSVDAGTDLVSTAAKTVKNVSGSVVDGVASGIHTSVDAGTDLVLTAAKTVKNTSAGAKNSVTSIKNAIFNNSEHVLDKTQNLLKKASEHLSSVLSVPNPNPEQVKQAISAVKSQAVLEMKKESASKVKLSASNISSVLQNPNATHTEIKRANESLKQSLVEHESEKQVNSARNSLHQSVKTLLNELSKPMPNSSVVNSASQLVKSQAAMELQHSNRPDDAVKRSAHSVVITLQDSLATHDQIRRTVENLHEELEHNASPTLLSTVASGIKSVVNGVGSVAQGIVKTTKDVVEDVVSGVSGTANVVINTVANVGSDVVSGVTNKNSEKYSVSETETGNNLIKSLKKVGDDIVTRVKTATIKADCASPTQSGGSINNGISILNMQGNSDVSTRMLLSNNFLGSKHVYFVRYHPNGTNVYDYKFEMKGGNVDNLELRGVNSLWNNSNSVGSISDSTISNGISVLNKIINNLSKSPQIGGYVRERISDKDEFYNEYKSYKLKYLSLKNKP